MLKTCQKIIKRGEKLLKKQQKNKIIIEIAKK